MTRGHRLMRLGFDCVIRYSSLSMADLHFVGAFGAP